MPVPDSRNLFERSLEKQTMLYYRVDSDIVPILATKPTLHACPNLHREVLSHINPENR